MYTTAEIILYFFIYAVMGWLWETIYCSAKVGRFVYRGFLRGPYCPIYGFGVLLVLYLVMPLRETTLELFVFASIVVTILEYVTGYLLQRIFGVTLWNYDDVPLNIHGLVAVPVSVFWGFCCVIVIKYIHPQISLFVNWLYSIFGIWLPIAIIIVMLVDTIISVKQMLGFKKMLVKMARQVEILKAALEEKKADQAVKHEERLATINARIMECLPPLTGFERHAFKAYPRIKSKQMKDFDTLKQLINQKRNAFRKQQK